MKTLVLIISLLLLVALAASAYAQPADSGPQAQARPIIAKIVKALGLTSEQTSQIRDIVVKLHQDAAAVIKSDASEDEKRTQVKGLRAKAADAITALLTPEQQAKAKKMRLVEMLMAPRRAAARMGIMFALSKLDLSDQQKASIKTAVEESKAAAKAIKDDTSLDQAAKKAKFMELRKATNAKVMAVLTPEQKKKLKEILARERETAKGKRGAR